jgi:hypothetical protein
MSHDMLHHAELKILFEVLHMFESIWIWNLFWIWIWKPYRKEMENELENLEKRKRRTQPSSAQPGRAPAPPDRQTPPVSGSSPLPRVLSLSLSARWGQPVAPVSFTRALPLSLSRGPGSPVAEPLPRAPWKGNVPMGHF